MRTPVSPLLVLSALLLAACGQTATPGPAASSTLVRLQVGTSAPRITPQHLTAQGMPSGGFDAQGAHLKLRVKDSQGQPVTFTNGVYAPAGDGDAFLTLNSANSYATTLLLPAGSYTFQSAVKDGPDETSTSGVLLAYGQSVATTVDSDHASVTLGVHAVMNPAAASLAFALPADTLYTNASFSLRLRVPTSSVGAQTYAVPTSDYAVGFYSVTGGVADAASASVLGVGVTASGTVASPQVSVSVPVSGWVQDGPGAETASYGPHTVTFTHAVQAATVSADVTAPNQETVDTPVGANAGQAVTLTGLAFDQGGQVSRVRLYDGTRMVASSEAAEQTSGVTAITFPGSDAHWTASWTPVGAGAHDLTLTVNDAAGNESSGTLTVTVTVP